MKKVFLSLFVALVFFAMTTTSCKKENSLIECAAKAAAYSDASLDYIADPSATTCNALRSAAQDWLNSCEKYLGSEEIDDLLAEIEELSCDV